MNRFFTKGIALIALVGAMTAFSTSKAEAALSLRISDGINPTLTIADDDANDDFAGLGAVGYVGAFGTWNINFHLGTGFPEFLNQPHVDLSYNAQDNSNFGIAGSYLQVEFTQTDTTGGPLGIHLGGTNNNTSTSAWAYRDDGNLAFGTSTLLANTTNAAASFMWSAGGAGGAGNYALTQVVKITKGGGGQANASGDYEIIPEPATLALFGLGLAGLAARRRRA